MTIKARLTFAVAAVAAISTQALVGSGAHAAVIGDPYGFVEIGTGGESTHAQFLSVSNGGCGYDAAVTVSTLGGCSWSVQN